MLLLTLAAGCASSPPRGPAGIPRPSPVPPLPAPAPAARTAGAAEDLQRDLDAIFNARIMDHAQWAVVVRSLDRGDVLYERNARKLMMPASNMKIVTLAGAAHALRWDTRFVTTLEAAGTVEGGTLRGDLYVRGGGDPTINTRNGRGAAVFREWAAALRAAGIERVDGRIVGDDQLFDEEPLGAGWSWDDLQFDYAAPVGALQFNESAADLVVRPAAAAGLPAAASLPPGTGLTVVNRAVTGPAGEPETLRYVRHADRPVLEITGTVPLAPDASDASPARVAGRAIAVVNPTLYFVESLKHALVADGIAITGEAVDIDEPGEGAAVGPGVERRIIARAESPPLREMSAVLMKVSQNLYAETFLKAAGIASGKAGTTAAGRQAVLAALRAWNIDATGLVMADGSGLSRYNYVTAALLADILTVMWRDRGHREPFAAALPVAGREGTLASRLRRTRAEGNAIAKTGSISNVRALSGYVRTRDGETLVFSIIANDFVLPAATVNWIADLAVEVLANVGGGRP